MENSTKKESSKNDFFNIKIKIQPSVSDFSDNSEMVESEDLQESVSFIQELDEEHVQERSPKKSQNEVLEMLKQKRRQSKLNQTSHRKKFILAKDLKTQYMSKLGRNHSLQENTVQFSNIMSFSNNNNKSNLNNTIQQQLQNNSNKLQDSNQLMLNALSQQNQNQNLKQNEENSNSQENIFGILQHPFRKQYAEYNLGPRFKEDGTLINYSIVGDSNWFEKYHQKQTQFSNSQRLSNQNNSKSNIIQKNEKNIILKPIMTSIHRQEKIKTPEYFLKPINNIQKSQAITSPQTKISTRDDEQNIVSKKQVLKQLSKIKKKINQNKQLEENFEKSMPLIERNEFTKSERTLKKFDELNNYWQSYQNQVNYSIRGRENNDYQCGLNLIQQSENFRKKQELIDQIENLKNEQERSGQRYWQKSLRIDMEKLNPKEKQLPDPFSHFQCLTKVNTQRPLEIVRQTETSFSKVLNTQTSSQTTRDYISVNKNESTQSLIQKIKSFNHKKAQFAQEMLETHPEEIFIKGESQLKREEKMVKTQDRFTVFNMKKGIESLFLQDDFEITKDEKSKGVKTVKDAIKEKQKQNILKEQVQPEVYAYNIDKKDLLSKGKYYLFKNLEKYDKINHVKMNFE